MSTPVLATSFFSIHGLIRKSPDRLDVLDFTGFEEKFGQGSLEKLYPRREGLGQLYPPPHYLTTGARVREWRGLSVQSQQCCMNRLRRREVRKRERALHAARLEEERLKMQKQSVLHLIFKLQQQSAALATARQILPHPSNATTSVGLGRPVPHSTPHVSFEGNEHTSSPLANANANNTNTDTIGSPSDRASSKKGEPPPTRRQQMDDAESEPDSESDDEDDPFHGCHGITTEIIQMSTCPDKAEILKGFHNLIGNAFRYKGHIISSTGSWSYRADDIGFLIDNNTRKDGSNYSWKCVQVGSNQWEFHRNNCDKLTTMNPEIQPGCCVNCWNLRHKFYAMCRGEQEARKQTTYGETNEADKNGNHKSSTHGLRLDNLKYKSPSLVTPRLEEFSRQIKVLRNKNYRLEAIVQMMEDDKVEATNINAEVLFDPTELKTLYRRLLEKEEVSQREIFDYLFEECIAVGKRIKVQGSAKGHEYSGLMIQFACMLRAQMSADLYDFFRKAFNLPPNQTLCLYSNADSTSPDGPMMQTIMQIADIFDKMGIPLNDWRRFVNMGWDSHVVKDLLGYCPHTKRLVGYSHDAFDINVIEQEFMRRYDIAKKADKAGEDGDDDDDTDTNPVNNKDEDVQSRKRVALGKHYMVFMCQTWTSKNKPFCFVAARYCLASLSARWVRVNKRQITAVLGFFGIVVNANSFDGATENRGAMIQDLTLSLRDMIPELLCDTSTTREDAQNVTSLSSVNTDTSRSVPLSTASTSQNDSVPVPDTDEESSFDGEVLRYFDDLARHPESVEAPKKMYGENDLPWDMMVAYYHPTLDRVIIVAAADMPHAVKKQVNAVEHSGKPKHKRDLHLNGLPIQLRMGFDAYQQSMDYTTEGAVMLYPRLSVDVYNKTSKSRMRFGLGARALGQSQIKCITDNEHAVSKASRRRSLISTDTGLPIISPGTYDSYILVAEKTDRFVDVMNGNRDKGCSTIDSPNHPHVYELLDYVKFLTQWKAQALASETMTCLDANGEETNVCLSDANYYFADSTHQDSCWTALSIVIMARRQLPKGHDIVQKHGGTDNIERGFGASRAKNSGANAQGTDGQISHIGSNMLQNLASSRKANTNKDSTFLSNEIEAVGKAKKRKISKVPRPKMN